MSKKQNPMKIEFNHSAKGLMESIGLTEERRQELNEAFKEAINNAGGPDDGLKPSQILELATNLANTPAELVFMSIMSARLIESAQDPLRALLDKF